MVEKYITVVSFVIVMRGLLIYPYCFAMRRTRLAHKGRRFVFNRVLGSYNSNTWLTFWLAVLWLIVYYFEHIRRCYEIICPI